MRLVPCLCVSACVMALGAVVPARAQYPTKPIRLVVNLAPGGAADTTARIVGQGLSSALGKSVVVDNRPGGGGNIAAEIVAKAPRDGYTLLLGSTFQVIAVSLYDKLGYDLLRDLMPITLLVSSPLVMTLHPSVAVKSVKELIALAKTKPNELAYASAGTGGGVHLAAALFCEMAGIRLTHVPFKGAGPALVAVLTGQVPIGFSTIAAATPHVKSGKLHALAVTSARRSALVPGLPTIAESGLLGYEADVWYGLNAPSGTPDSVISRLHHETERVLKTMEVRERLEALGVEPVGSTPHDYGQFLRSEIAKWGRIVKVSGARPD